MSGDLEYDYQPGIHGGGRARICDMDIPVGAQEQGVFCGMNCPGKCLTVLWWQFRVTSELGVQGDVAVGVPFTATQNEHDCKNTSALDVWTEVALVPRRQTVDSGEVGAGGRHGVNRVWTPTTLKTSGRSGDLSGPDPEVTIGSM